jgi:hypothetical protein
VLLAEHVYREPPPLRSTGLNVSLKVEQVMMRVLAKDPRLRFTTVSEFAQQLEGAFQEESLSLTLPSPIVNESPPLPNASTLQESPSRNVQALQAASSVSWVNRGMLPPPRPVSASATRQPVSGTEGNGSGKTLQKLDVRYLYARKGFFFRVISLLLISASAFSIPQYPYLWVLSLLVVLPLFIIYILLANRWLALFLAVMLACYWGFIGTILDETTLGLGSFAGFDVLGMAVFGVSLMLYGGYAVAKRV